jgi:cytochrome P450
MTTTDAPGSPSAGPAVFDPLEEGFVDWPYDQYRRLRADDPVHYSELLHGWVLTRYDDVRSVLRDPTVSSEIDNATPTPITQSEITRRDRDERNSRTLVLLDDPAHARLRKLVSQPFRPSEIEKLRAMVQDKVRTKADELVAAAEATAGPGGAVELDLIADYAYPLPVEIFCRMLGIPDEDHTEFRYWINCVARSLDPVMDQDERDEVLAGMDQMYDYMDELVEAKRGRDDDDVLSGLIHAEEDGDKLTHDELIAQVLTLYVAGHEPTASVVGTGTLALLDHPDQWAALRADRSLLRNAVAEFLRYDGPNQFVRRIAMRDTTFETPSGPVTVPARSVLYCSPGAANRDEAYWGPTVDQVDIRRSDAGTHLQFGSGVHMCLGTHLARLQAEEMFDALLDRVERFEPAGDPVWSTRMIIRGLNQLPLRAHLA